MSQVTEWWSGCRDMLAQSQVRLFGWQGGKLFTGAPKGCRTQHKNSQLWEVRYRIYHTAKIMFLRGAANCEPEFI